MGLIGRPVGCLGGGLPPLPGASRPLFLCRHRRRLGRQCRVGQCLVAAQATGTATPTAPRVITAFELVASLARRELVRRVGRPRQGRGDGNDRRSGLPVAAVQALSCPRQERTSSRHPSVMARHPATVPGAAPTAAAGAATVEAAATAASVAVGAGPVMSAAPLRSQRPPFGGSMESPLAVAQGRLRRGFLWWQRLLPLRGVRTLVALARPCLRIRRARCCPRQAHR